MLAINFRYFGWHLFAAYIFVFLVYVLYNYDKLYPIRYLILIKSFPNNDTILLCHFFFFCLA